MKSGYIVLFSFAVLSLATQCLALNHRIALYIRRISKFSPTGPIPANEVDIYAQIGFYGRTTTQTKNGFVKLPNITTFPGPGALIMEELFTDGSPGPLLIAVRVWKDEGEGIIFDDHICRIDIRPASLPIGFSSYQCYRQNGGPSFHWKIDLRIVTSA